MLSRRPKIVQKPSKIAQKPRKMRRKSPTRLLWRRRRKTSGRVATGHGTKESSNTWHNTRGHVTESRGQSLHVPGCLCSNITVWKEEKFTVLPGQGIKQRVTKTLPLAKTGEDSWIIQVVTSSSISIIASARIIGAHASTIKTLLSSSIAGFLYQSHTSPHTPLYNGTGSLIVVYY
jgi:hypothetical protein